MMQCIYYRFLSIYHIMIHNMIHIINSMRAVSPSLIFVIIFTQFHAFIFATGKNTKMWQCITTHSFCGEDV